MNQQQLFKTITYDPKTGVMKRLKSRSNSMVINANSEIKINGINYSAKRLAWLYVTGNFPEKDIITLDGTENLKFSNLFMLSSLDVSEIDQTFMHKFFYYDKHTGNLLHKLRFTRGIKVGSIAGNVIGTLPDRGYISVNICGKRYFAHRLIWLYLHGNFPDKQIDHINHDRTDNRIENLRLATNHTNMKNKSKYVTNKTGYSGVSKLGSFWMSRIGVDGNKVLLGTFKTFNEAVAARKAAEKLLNYHSNHGK